MKIRSIRSKILISIIGITLVTALAITGVFYQKAADMIEQNYVELLQQRIQLMCENIDNMLMDICNININASCDSDLKEKLTEYLAGGDEEKLNELSSLMRSFSKRNNAMDSIYLIIPDTEQIITTLDYPVYRTLEGEGLEVFLQSIQEDAGPTVLDDLVHDGKYLLTCTEAIVDEEGRTLAYICANVAERKLSYDYLNQQKTDEISKLSLIKKHTVIAERTLSKMGDAFDKAGIYQQWTENINTAGTDQDSLFVYCQGGFSGCGIFAQVDRGIILEELMTMRKYIAGIAAVFVLIALAAAVYLTRIVYRPIKKLKTAMQSVSEGEISTRAEIISNDEIGMAAVEFNRMLDQIEALIARLIQEEQMKKDAELEALQYQITPHFMYNTLNSVKCYAMICGQKQIAGVIEDFVELLQTCISKKGIFLTVAEEVQVLQNYIRLQEFRSGETFCVKYEVMQEAQQCLVPRLILQPLVENAILHGMDLKHGQNELTIRISTDKDRLYLEVRDNGRGMSKDQIRELLTKKVKKTKGLTAVGIPNVRDRLHLYYGEKAELSYESTSNGTIARIFLPAAKDGEWEHEEGFISR